MTIKTLVGAALLAALTAGAAQAQQIPSRIAALQTATSIESYYRVALHRRAEFRALYKKNHLPILLELKRQGIIENVRIDYVANHLPGDGAWTMRVIVTWASAEAGKDGIQWTDLYDPMTERASNAFMVEPIE